MEKTLLPKYLFGDITVYMRVGTSEEQGGSVENPCSYINLTDYRITDNKQERLVLNSNADYIIIMCSFFHNAYRSKNIPTYACEVSFEDLLRLAGINDAQAVRRFNDGDGFSDDLLAILCARKIVNYNYGTVLRCEGDAIRYGFYRQAYETVDGKKRKTRMLVCEKDFCIV